jgi:hypothetical protein
MSTTAETLKRPGEAFGLAVAKALTMTKYKGHQGATLDHKLRRAESHERLYWDRTERALKFARECGEKRQWAYESRDRLLGMLNETVTSHYPNGKGGCRCGAQKCDLMMILENRWVRERLSDFRERQQAA